MRASGSRRASPRTHRGAAAVEFALVTALFLLTLLVGIIEVGRAFFYMNAAAEATRYGARIAVVCDITAGQQDIIRARMQQRSIVLRPDNIEIEYLPSGCVAGTCSTVTVRVLPNATFDTLIPFVPLRWTLPAFATTLPTESLDSAGGANSVCN